MSTVDDNRRLVIGAWEQINAGEAGAALVRHFSEDYVRHSGADDHTRDQLGEALAAMAVAFPDLRSSFDDVIAEGDRVAFRWSATGTHLGGYMGMPATRKRIAASGITIARVADARIVEDWASWNKHTVLYALGIVPIDVRD
jgi:steroid delta-isomerase-like uncharacterized protein